ncbi:hypothetical protein Fcan01_19064 [Folsomia candida]|uniref:Uncharacterized protein n=1 Tax=Folsomia candida TaxID=158441 RepID=A0A226DNG3_FOLCA|nr:hypothetical protein Fcan01_19064 [Folsomia candida]
MYTTHFLPLLLRHLKICQRLNSVAFGLDRKSENFVMTKKPFKIRMFRLQIVSHLAYCVIIVGHLCFSPLPKAKQFQGLVFLVIYIIILCGRWNYDLDVAVVQIINSAIKFETKLFKGTTVPETNTETKLMKLFIHLTFYIIIAMMVAIPVLIFVDPCSPPFLLSIREDCASISWTNCLGAQHLAILFDLWMLIHVLMGGVIEIIYILFAGTMSILNYFDVLKRNIREAQTVTEFKACTKFYRSIHILEKLFNGFLMVRLIPGYMFLMPALQVLTQYVSVMMHDEIPMPAFLIFPLVGENSFVNNIFVFTLASWVNNISKKILREQVSAIARCGWAARKSSLIKSAKACTALKIKFGSNFIDSGTPMKNKRSMKLHASSLDHAESSFVILPPLLLQSIQINRGTENIQEKLENIQAGGCANVICRQR